MYQWMNGEDPMTGYTSSTNIALQNLQPNAMYAVSVVGINSCVGTGKFTNNISKITLNSWAVTLQCVIVLTPTSTCAAVIQFSHSLGIALSRL